MAETKYVGHIVKFPRTLIGLFQRGWWEIPEVMGASAHGLLGFVLGSVGVYNIIKNDRGNPEYKKLYIIMRSDDPRVKNLKNPVFTQFKA